MSDLDDLAHDLATAADHGAEKAGHAAVSAGAKHMNSSVRELLRVENITTSMNGELSATVTASQPEYVDTPAGPVLAGTAGTADVMAAAAAEVGVHNIAERR